MCFSSVTVDDPTQQPIKITQSNETHDRPQTARRRSSAHPWHNKPAFHDYTADSDLRPVMTQRSQSRADIEANHPNPDRKPSNAGVSGMAGNAFRFMGDGVGKAKGMGKNVSFGNRGTSVGKHLIF
jgi:hypothetical protein